MLIRQRPGSAKGVCFITLEDETGTANLVVWPDAFAAQAEWHDRNGQPLADIMASPGRASWG